MRDAPGRRQFYERLLPEEAEVITRRREVWKLPPTAGRVGLALSGGGIRSATFNLGVVQVFARTGLLKWFDYLSTVSGGGYVGSCLSAIINFETQPAERPADALVHHMGQPESLAIEYLRSGANYLAPRGLLDVLRIPAVLLRGIAINLLVLAPFTALIALLTAWWYPNLVDLSARVNFFFDRGGDLVFFTLTPWVVLAALLWIALFPVVSTLRPNPPYGMRARYELSFAALLLALVVVPTIEAGPALYHAFADIEADVGGLAGAASAAVMAILPFVYSIHTSMTQQGHREPETSSVLSSVRDQIKLVAVGLLGPLILLLVYFILVRWLYGQPELALLPGYYSALHQRMWMLAGFAGGVFVFTRLMVDINRTGMHRFYRDRLSAAYLFNPRTLHKEDTIKLSQLDSARTGAPYHLLNASLNIPGTKDLNLKGRATDFFLMSPKWCGSFETGYGETTRIEEADAHFNLGTALAISGAAASPYMGPSTSKLLIWVLTILNVRLDYWFRNPGLIGSRRLLAALTPNQVGPIYLIAELLGWLNAKSRAVNLSDGGQIENLGLYELLRRRCRFIVCCDAEEDDALALPSLGRLTAYARLDDGVTITWENIGLLQKGADGFSRTQWIYGTIDYGPGAEPGHIVYLKASLGGGEPQDIVAYHDVHPAFPQQSTLEQFFDTSQFESYRALGYFIASQLFDDQSNGVPDISAWFEARREQAQRKVASAGVPSQ